MNTLRDEIYAAPRDAIEPFRFDAQVARVFPDMIRRSVPGYATMVEMTGVIAGRHAQPGSRLYDLGCSLGAVTLAMRHTLQAGGCTIIAIDNSADMLGRAQELLAADTSAAAQQTPVQLHCEDIRDSAFSDASVVALNFTLQFIPPADRPGLLSRIAAGMRRGGVLVLSEKVRFSDAGEQARNDALHVEFKRAQGYSEMEIAQKRNALDNVLVPDTLEEHVARLRGAGFAEITPWFRCFNFLSIIARMPGGNADGAP
jgi:tRNA (cmo5U34)-methyltransferase